MKIQSNKGNIFTIVIIVLALFTIFIGTIFMQINNQIKSNKNTLELTSAKYAAEAGIENAILEIIKQIEYKTNNYGNDSKTYYNKSKFVYDDYGKVKEKFISASELINSLEVENDELNICKQNLQNIISNKYTSPEDIIYDVVEFKLKSIHSVATEKDNNIKNNIKTKVYSAIDEVNEGLILLYNSSVIHSGDEHKEIEIEIIDENGTKKVKPEYVKYEFMEDKEGETKSKYKIKNLITSVYGEGEGVDSLKKDMKRIKDSVHNVYNKQQWTESLVKLNEFEGSKIYDILGRHLNDNDKILGKIDFLSWQWNHDINVLHKTINNIKKDIRNIIDTGIKEKATKSLEASFYELYLTYFKDPELQSTQVYNDIITFLINLEEVKKNLAELKCKLGGESINIGGNIELPEDNENDGDVSGGNGQTPEISIEIELDKLEENLKNNTSYEVNKIDKTPLVVEIVSNKINTVDDLELEIVSKGVLNKKEVTRKATVVFKTTKEDGEFVTNYSIINYSKD